MKYLQRLVAFSIAIFTVLLFTFIPRVAAVDITSGVCDATSKQPVVCQDAAAGSKTNPLLGKDGIVTKGIQVFIIAIGVISVFVILVNAVKMITSNGDSSSVSKARNGILYAAIGLVVAMSAQLIVVTVINKLN